MIGPRREGRESALSLAPAANATVEPTTPTLSNVGGHSTGGAERNDGNDQEVVNQTLTLDALRSVFSKSAGQILSLFAVYVLEYSIITCFADRMAL